ncbi:hypothetical protein GCM10023331_14150 [Algivirga pacifica]|uniref:Guanylate kinase-like domain-containing protein n=1 Tax=Algivirga pacifica TaxID=1162670 RepID=A0ABP9D6T1_9BACT
MSLEDFRKKIKDDAFVEYEEVYEGVYYGTLKSEVERIWASGKHVVMDVDVIGGINLKKYFGNDAMAIFIQPPSVEELERRLRSRATDPEESIRERVDKAADELKYATSFDVTLINDDLQEAFEKAEELVHSKIKE